ncbi:hypothetical protein FDA94_31885 [Herbidospora galbida]|uniref:Uncharacterized protein n=1 Tax=Herbidospora galbida TaxID=2575442 RepID=A0A4U3M8W2_9ACTN|nr:hypothetical protein [Herbidospora galbida]TKK83966.1 hypothetical protein FDA94_31885 [Herbidospora galbida]
MPLWGRRLLVVLAIWVAALAFAHWSPMEDDFGDFVLLFTAPLTLGLILGLLAGLPWWLPVGLLAFPGTFLLVYAASPWLDVLEVETWPKPVGLAFPAVGYLIVSWLFSPGFRWPKIGVGVLLAAGVVGASPLEDLRSDTEFEDMITSTSVPLVVPVIPGHTLVSSSSLPLNGEIELRYASPDGETEIEVYLHPETRDPQEMCLDPAPRYPIDERSECREAAPGVWVRTAPGWVRALGRAGGATMQMIAHDLPEDVLVRGFAQTRPVTPEELVELRDV